MDKKSKNVSSKWDFNFIVIPFIVTFCLLIQYGFAWSLSDLINDIFSEFNLFVKYGIIWNIEEPIYKHIKYLGLIFIFLCVISFLYEYLKTKFPNFAHNKIFKWCWFILIFGLGSYPIVVYLLSLLIPFLICPVISTYILYQAYKVIFIIEVVAFLMLMIYGIIREYCIHPTLRMITVIIGELFPVIGVLGNIIMLVYPSYIEKYDYESLGQDSIIVSIIIYTILLIPIFIDNRRLYAFIPFKQYVLYLRSFTDNDGIDSLDVETIKKLPIVEVADPSGRESKIRFNGYDFYLPIKNWQPQLKYYISRAKYIICNIGITEGVQWEMFENDLNLNKYIFIATKIEQFSLQSINIKYSNHELFSILKEAKKRYRVGTICFCYYKDNWYFSRTIDTLIECLFKSDFSCCVDSIESHLMINRKAYKPNRVIVGTFMDFLRRIWMLLRPQTLAKIAATPGIVAYFICGIFGWIFPYLIILAGVFFLVCKALNDIGYNIALATDYAYSDIIIGLIVGVVLLVRNHRDK